MKTAGYRRVRTAVGGLVLGFCALAFADVGDRVSAGVARAALWPQFAPSLMSLLQGAGWVSAGCVAVILLTLVFGRVYCAMLCPLGVLMDLSARLARRTGKKRKLSHRPGLPWLRAFMVAVCAAGLLAGTAVPLGLLDPYSLFGKITASTLRPALGFLNHLVSKTGLLAPVDVSPVPWVSRRWGLLALIVLAAVHRDACGATPSAPWGRCWPSPAMRCSG
ncbi:MAG: 4Fe-4S binding protein [Kiritimatiellia bacterium]